MNRANLLSTTRRFLESKGIADGICEGRVLEFQRRLGHFPEIKHQRLILFTGVQDSDQLKQFCEDRNLIIEAHNFSDLNEYEHNELFTPIDVNLTHNWRGRVLRFGQDFNLNTDQSDFERIFLKSYWRFMITQREDLFFGHHDLVPLFYHPGHSTAGFDDPLPSIRSFLRFIYFDYNNNDRGRFDPDYDYVVLFGKRTGQNEFTKFRYTDPAGTEKNEWTHREFSALIDAVGAELLAEAIKNSLAT